MRGVGWEFQSMQALGYRQWKNYASGKISKEEVVKDWKKEEKNYAKRQMTWFNKDKRIIWFNISKKDWLKDVENTVGKWHNKDINN
jgi:tRNA dimethylallyltransferase